MSKSPIASMCFALVIVLLMAAPVSAVKSFRFSNYGGGHQIWFEVEDFDERVPDTDDFYTVVDADGAFGQAIKRTVRGEGMIRWTFDISKAGGSGGTWRFWGRVINPSNQSDFMIVEGDPSDPPLPPGPLYPRAGSEAAGFGNAQRAFDENSGPPWTWSGRNGAEAHTKTLQDGENTMYIVPRQGDASTFWDVFMWADDPSYVPTDEDYENATIPNTAVAAEPIPASGVTDIPYYASLLRWSPGDFAATHNVYFSEHFEDVNSANTAALVAEGLSETTVEIPATELGKTYYWRVDEVNGAPDFAVHAGEVWSFTVEPLANLVTDVTATSDSEFNEGTAAANVVNGSGLSDGLQSNLGGDMWLSAGLPATITFTFDVPHVLHEMRIWNHNQAIESFLGFGAKDVTLELSADGIDFSVVEGVSTMTQASGAVDSPANDIIALNNALAKAARMTITSPHGPVQQTGLSEVQFYAIPAFPREFSPADGVDVNSIDETIAWRAGRFATEHQVLLSQDKSAVASGNALVAMTIEKHYAPPNLEYGSGYFYQIIDVGEDGATYAGPIVQFQTPSTGTIDDMESYADAEFLEIWATWVDGFDDPSNGSLVGVGDTGTPETTEVYEGDQSLPLSYDLTSAAVAEATRTFDPALDLTRGAPDALGIYFKGDSPQLIGVSVYLTVTDSGGRSVKVSHPDPAATLLTEWTLLEVAMAELSGLETTRIRSIAIGVEGAGATGRIFADFLHVSADAASN